MLKKFKKSSQEVPDIETTDGITWIKKVVYELQKYDRINQKEDIATCLHDAGETFIKDIKEQDKKYILYYLLGKLNNES
jgi:hypothetical protein